MNLGMSSNTSKTITNTKIIISKCILIDISITVHSPVLDMADLIGNIRGAAINPIEIPGHSGIGVSGI